MFSKRLKAILDRLDESVEFGLPDLEARKAPRAGFSGSVSAFVEP